MSSFSEEIQRRTEVRNADKEKRKNSKRLRGRLKATWSPPIGGSKDSGIFPFSHPTKEF